LKAAQWYAGLQMIVTPQLEEIVSTFEITNKQIFSVAGRMLKPERCRLTDKRFEAVDVYQL